MLNRIPKAERREMRNNQQYGAHTILLLDGIDDAYAEFDARAERIKALEEGLRKARRPHFVDRNDFYSCPKSRRGCANWEEAKEGRCTCDTDEHNARIDALVGKEKSDVH